MSYARAAFEALSMKVVYARCERSEKCLTRGIIKRYNPIRQELFLVLHMGVQNVLEANAKPM